MSLSFRPEVIQQPKATFKKHMFGPADVQRIAESVSNLRSSAPQNIASSQNMHFRTTNVNPWWVRNPVSYQNVVRIAQTLASPLSQSEKNQIYSSYMLIRNVPSITARNASGVSYITTQSLHLNFERTRTHGDAFKQIIYYVDTPKYANGRTASPGNRGQLLVRSSTNGNTQIITPEKGQAVYFNPADTFHEVVAQSNANQNVNVDRKMIIMLLYKAPPDDPRIPNVRANQYRQYSPTFPSLVRSIGGHIPRPSGNRNRQTPNSLNVMLSGLRLGRNNNGASGSGTRRNNNNGNRRNNGASGSGTRRNNNNGNRRNMSRKRKRNNNNNRPNRIVKPRRN